MQLRGPLSVLVLGRMVLQLFNIYGTRPRAVAAPHLLLCLCLALADPGLRLKHVSSPSSSGGYLRALGRSRANIVSLGIFLCYTAGVFVFPDSFPGLVSIMAVGACLTAQAIVSPKFSDSAGADPISLRTLCLQSLSKAASLTFVCSVVPMATVPDIGVLYSPGPCLLHCISSFLSLWLWVTTAAFVQFRFQLSVAARRSGLWTRLKPGTAGQNPQDSVHAPADISPDRADSVRTARVFSRGDIAAAPSATGSAHRLDSYCAIGGPPTPGSWSARGFVDSFGNRSQLWAEWAERAIFNVLSTEVGPLRASGVLHAVFLLSSAMAAAMSLSAYTSAQDCLGVLGVALSEAIMCFTSYCAFKV